MPYFRCLSCGLTSYSASPAGGPCPTCSASLFPELRMHVSPGSVRDLTRVFRARSEAPSEARRAVNRLPLPERIRDELSLIATELVSNSVLHAGLSCDGVIDLRVTSGDGVLHLEVHDGGPGFAPPTEAAAVAAVADPDRIRGYGLAIVGQLSDDWGVTCDGDGCTVWCSVADADAFGVAAEAEVAAGHEADR